MNHPSNKHDEWAKGKQNNRQSYKKGRSQHTRYFEKSTGSSGSVKCLTLSSQMQSALCTDCGMSQAEFFYWTLQPVKLEGQDEAQHIKWSKMIYYFVCLPLFLLFHMARKASGLEKYTFQHGSLPHQKEIIVQAGEILLGIS